MQINSVETVKELLIQNHTLQKEPLFLQCGDCIIRVQSDSKILLTELKQYFRHLLIAETFPTLTVIAIQSEILKPPISFQDWPREPGKKGRKDSYCNIEGGRLIYKMRTGMLFLQSENYKIAAGPCLANSNQIINFINSQHMNWLQQRDWLICHAAAIVDKKYAYAVAGFSGGGKSTFMLSLMDDDKINFLSNDRLFICNKKTIYAEGIAKLPRINPGTIVNNPRLHALIPAQKREQLLNLPKQQLWDLEEKYDVDIESIYGPGRIAKSKPLKAFIVLNWQHHSDKEFNIETVNLQNRQDLLPAIMKSSGPFYQDRKGQFLSDLNVFDPKKYLTLLTQIKVYEVSGKVDFELLKDYFYQNILDQEK